jgi:hypothetical protein
MAQHQREIGKKEEKATKQRSRKAEDLDVSKGSV